MMRALIIGFFAVAMLMFAGLVSPQAKAAPTIPAVKQQSLVEDVGWRSRRVAKSPLGNFFRFPKSHPSRRAN
jgi:hypothetical protein